MELISLNPKGGTPPYNYSWSNGEQTAVIDGLIEGFYLVTVTDMDNCQSTQSFYVPSSNEEYILL